MDSASSIYEPLPPLPLTVCDRSLDCPLSAAPGCFPWTLKRVLEQGGQGYTSNGLSGFIDHFCRGLDPRASAEVAVDYWMRNCRNATIRAVLEFARADSVRNIKLIKAYHRLLESKLTSTHVCIYMAIVIIVINLCVMYCLGNFTLDISCNMAVVDVKAYRLLPLHISKLFPYMFVSQLPS